MSPTSSQRQATPQTSIARRGAAGASRFGLDPYLLLVVLFSLFSIGPLLQPGYQWDAHDARHSVYFLFEFHQGIEDGLLYPRWQPDFAFGYGYPFFNIYGPLATYAGEAFHLLGLDYTGAVKTVFALSIIASGLAMYGFVKQVLGRRAGLVAAVAYMVIPYRLVDLYVRAALAESVAYVFVPLVLWGVWATLYRPRVANVFGLALAYAALMYTSPLVTLLLTLILVFYIAALTLARINDAQPLRKLSRESLFPLLGHLAHVLLPTAFSLILGLGLSALFALPAMTESRFVRVDQWYGGRYAWGGDFVEFFQLFSPSWGFGTSVPGPNDNVSFQLGVVPVVLSLFALVPLVHKRSRSQLARSAVRLTLFFAILTAVVVFLMLEVSAPLWQILPLVRLAQFPWRLLTLTVFAMAFLTGVAAKNLRPLKTWIDIPTLILVSLLILGSLPYMQAEMSEQEVSLAGLMRFQQSADEMTGSTAWVREIPTWSPMADYHIAGEPLTSKINYDLLYQQPGRAHARTLELRVDSERVEYSAERPVLLTFNTFYYPGWHAYLLDAETDQVIEELPIALQGDLGLMTVRVPAGVGRVLLQFEDTPVRKLGTALSAFSLLILGILVATAWVRRRRTGRH
ncbi:MAG: hypothetical protein PVH11_00555 [Anaerolineae bacterium]|jgi:hypothetical protein